MGIKLKPTEIEQLLHNLYKKATGGSDSGFPECDLYGEKEPWEIWEACKGGSGTQLTKNQKELYVFTKVKKKTVNGSRLDRTVGTGAWKGEDTGVKIYGNESDEGTPSRLVGIRKRFRYESRTAHEGRWIMYEYSLDASTLTHAKFQNYVLCRIKKMDGSEKKRKLLRQEENLDQTIKINDDNTIARLPYGDDGHIIIDVSDDSEDKPNIKEDEKVNINIIGTTPVEKQFNSPESPPRPGELTAIPGGGNEYSILDPNSGGVDDDHTEWARAFAEELTEGQAHLMQETEIEMLLNDAYYLDNWINSELLYN